MLDTKVKGFLFTGMWMIPKELETFVDRCSAPAEALNSSLNGSMNVQKRYTVRWVAVIRHPIPRPGRWQWLWLWIDRSCHPAKTFVTEAAESGFTFDPCQVCAFGHPSSHRPIIAQWSVGGDLDPDWRDASSGQRKLWWYAVFAPQKSEVTVSCRGQKKETPYQWDALRPRAHLGHLKRSLGYMPPWLLVMAAVWPLDCIFTRSCRWSASRCISQPFVITQIAKGRLIASSVLSGTYQAVCALKNSLVCWVRSPGLKGFRLREISRLKRWPIAAGMVTIQKRFVQTTSTEKDRTSRSVNGMESV